MMEISAYSDPITRLLDGGEVPLEAWLAEPLAVQQAEVRLAEVRRRLHSCFSRGGSCFGLRMAEFIANYWCGRDMEAEYGNLRALLAHRREEAMLELVYGQLLIARKDAAAWEHLDKGFGLAAHRLESEAYFIVLKRHDLLRILPLRTQPVEAAGLRELLAEAAMIHGLKGDGARQSPAGSGHRDTLD